MQPVDFTTLSAIKAELCRSWLPARVEQVYQRDRHTIALALRTLKGRDWLNISWHPQAARIGIGSPPPKDKDTFTFSDQLRHQLNGLALFAIENVAPWERVLDLQFARRPGEAAQWHLYVEIMGKYSNVILTDAGGQIVTAAHQVHAQQSSVRQIQTGQPYQLPPTLFGTIPKLEESFQSWQERVSLIPGSLKSQLVKCYRGMSPAVAQEMIRASGLQPQQGTDTLTQDDWQQLFKLWQDWLIRLENSQFQPGWLESGYTVMSWQPSQAVESVQTLIDSYYTARLQEQQWQQLHHQLRQKIDNLLKKLNQKANTFRQRLQQSDTAEGDRHAADLLMANLSAWQPGMTKITLTDFETGQPITIKLNPEKNAVQNAQYLYKQHQKLKRAKIAVAPLLDEVMAEINYLEQVKTTIEAVENYQSEADLQTLEEIRQELMEEQYFNADGSRPSQSESSPYIYHTPSGFELWIGRNNRQNDLLTFRTATDYDLWLHTQEIPGSHVLLRLDPGAVAEAEDLQYAADLAAYYSRAKQSEQVPVVYTKPKYVYKPKGAKPGMAIYQQESVIWGRPQIAKNYRIAKNLQKN